MGNNKKSSVGACKSYCMNFDYFKIVNSRKESIISKLTRDRVSKSYWWIVIKNRAWELVSLIV